MSHQIWVIGAAVVLMVSPAAASLADGCASSGVAVAAGSVTSASRAAMPGVAVDLYAWPSDAVLKALKPGEFVPTTLLAMATTNSAGRYMLRVPAAKLKGAAVESGYANLEIFSSVGGFWFFPYQTAPLPTRPSAPVTVNLDRKNKVNCGTDSVGYHDTFSGFVLQCQRSPAWAVVGQGYIVKDGNNTRGDSVKFSYTQGASHSQASALGIGLSGYGFDAGYNGAGTHDSTAHRSADFPNASANAWFRTMFATGQFRGMCLGPHGVPIHHNKQHGACPRTYKNDLGMLFYVHKCFWLVHSIGWFGGTNIQQPRKAPSTPANNCAPYLKGSNFHGDFGTAVTWSSGFALGSALGIKNVTLKASFNSSAQTGYDINAVMYFHFGHNGYLCGTNGNNDTAAILVQRGNRK